MDRSKWEYKKLGEVCTCLIGLTYKPTDVVENGGSVVLRSCNIQNNSLSFDDIVRVSCTIPSNKIVQKGDILMCSRNGSFKLVGKVAEINDTNEPMSFGAFMTIIRSEYNKFLFYFFLSNSFRNQLHSGQTTTINQITTKMLNNMSVYVPSISDQQRIVAELDCLNEMIAVKQEQLKEFDKLAQSIFYDMFGDPSCNNKKWDVASFSNCFKLSSGDGLSAHNIVEGEYPVYGGNGIVGYHNEFNLEGDVIIIGRVGALCGNVRYVRGRIFVTDNAFILTKLKEFNNTYLKNLLEILNLRKYAREAMQPVISNKTLKDLAIPLPPLALQQQFADKISAIEAQKELVKQSIAETQALLAYTMDKYFG